MTGHLSDTYEIKNICQFQTVLTVCHVSLKSINKLDLQERYYHDTHAGDRKACLNIYYPVHKY